MASIHSSSSGRSSPSVSSDSTQARYSCSASPFYLAAGTGAIVLGWIDDRIGAKRVVLLSLAAIISLAVVLTNLESKEAFWIVAGILALFFGPVQSSSRTLMTRLSPAEQRTKLFGLYALAGRAIAPFGPAAVSWVILATGNQRAGIFVVTAFLSTGAILLLLVREPERRGSVPEATPGTGPVGRNEL